MADIDAERDAVVVRIVYDGPPFAGKTTSVRSLARGFGRVAETPQEVDGRTMYFDWLEYTGGLFDGRKIHCQIFSVPGQPELDARRRALLALADAVIFVLDSSCAESVALGAVYVGQLAQVLRERPGAPVGVIVQANKRDLPGALSREAMHELLGKDFARIALTESEATVGLGIRETFVFAVRLAIDRVRVEMEEEELAQVKPAISSAQHLLQALEAVPLTPGAHSTHPAPPPRAAGQADLAALLPEGRTSRLSLMPRPPQVHEIPALPGPTSPDGLPPGAGAGPPAVPGVTIVSGAIWPPVEGRMLLHEVSTLGLVARQLEPGEWEAGQGTQWRVHSGAGDEFESFDEGRRALIVWAREHALLSSLLSSQRCIVLGDSGHGTWRLWQIVRRAPSLRAWLAEGAQAPVALLYQRMIEAAATLGDSWSRFGATRLRPTLDTFGRGIGRYGGWYVGLVPGPAVTPVALSADVEREVSEQLRELLRAELQPRCGELERQVVELWSGTAPWDAVVTSAIARALTVRARAR